LSVKVPALKTGTGSIAPEARPLKKPL